VIVLTISSAARDYVERLLSNEGDSLRAGMSRAAVMAGALTLSVAAPAAAQTEATTATVGKKRLNVRAGQRVHVAGVARPAAPGRWASLQVRRGRGWRTVDSDRTAATGRYVLRGRIHRAMSRPARLKVGRVRRPLGRVNVYRWAHASWYGPGLYGNPLGCGGTLTYGTVGVAHKTLPCGSKLMLRHRGRTLRVRVIDRGPYVGGREYDLTEATARKLRFRGHGPIQTTR
jgi:rare lipoprotein A